MADSDDQAQLGQIRVPLERAAAAFETPDASGRLPIVIVPERVLRLRFDLLGVAVALLLVALLGLASDWSGLVIGLALAGAVALAVLAAMSAFFVRVPEATSVLLLRAGRHAGILGPGSHLLMPWVAVSHVVTRRHIPFELPRVEAPTRDNVGARLDALLTFTIEDPSRFVYAIAAPDFEVVLRTTCQDAVRSLLRTLSWENLLNLAGAEEATLRCKIEAQVENYGVRIAKLNIVTALPDSVFLDLQGQLQQASARARLAELEADTHAVRLARLEELLREYPRAADWEWQSEQLEVARDIAANSRAIVQVGEVADIANAVLSREMATGNSVSGAEQASRPGPGSAAAPGSRS